MIIQEQVELLPYNTFKIRSKARYFTSIQSMEDFQKLLTTPVFMHEKHLVLGGGSNILLTGDFQGLVIKMDIKGIQTISENEDTIEVKAGGGENWHSFVMHCVAKNWGGVENLSLIPGTVGAAPLQNIGAYGVEIKEVIKNVETIDLQTGQVAIFANDECGFGYRESVFKQKYKGKKIISSVTLSLTKKNHRYNTSYGALQDTLTQQGVTQLSVEAISRAVITIRQQKLPDPAKVGNAGSFFKNPTVSSQQYQQLKNQYPEIPGYSSVNQEVKIPAAWMIESCGWKGKTFESIGVHPNQALVLVNYKDGTGEKIWKLATEIMMSVKEKFSIELQPEVNVI